MAVRIIHLASFAGNIGDVANHEGFYTQFKKLFVEEVVIEKLEMRDFYLKWNKKQFDENFVDFVNQYDLLIIGGGNFFELCWDYSSTGTTFNIKLEVLRKIKVPIFINGIGIDDTKGTNLNNIKKFRLFLEQLFSMNNVFFTVRNDGSYRIIQKYFDEFSSLIYKIPDHGFFLSEVETIKRYKAKKEIKSIGFNIAIDMAGIRYKNIDYNIFINNLSKQINYFLSNTNYNIYLLPHIQSDYIAILDILKLIKNEYARTRISIAPLIQGQELKTFRCYKDCEMIFGMRFHANVCSMSLGVPSLGLITYPKHGNLYDELGIPDRKIEIDNPTFFDRLEQELSNIIKNNRYCDMLNESYHEVREHVLIEKSSVYSELKCWLNEKKII